MQQQLLAAAYSGLLDGIEPSASFPDMWMTFREIQHCSLNAALLQGDGAGDVAGRQSP
jgi:hypothetical protein